LRIIARLLQLMSKTSRFRATVSTRSSAKPGHFLQDLPLHAHHLGRPPRSAAAALDALGSGKLCLKSTHPTGNFGSLKQRQR
jgi:hypothetical protein